MPGLLSLEFDLDLDLEDGWLLFSFLCTDSVGLALVREDAKSSLQFFVLVGLHSGFSLTLSFLCVLSAIWPLNIIDIIRWL